MIFMEDYAVSCNDLSVPPDVYHEQSGYWNGYKITERKVNKKVLKYLKKNFSDGINVTGEEKRRSPICAVSAIFIASAK